MSHSGSAAASVISLMPVNCPSYHSSILLQIKPNSQYLERAKVNFLYHSPVWIGQTVLEGRSPISCNWSIWAPSLIRLSCGGSSFSTWDGRKWTWGGTLLLNCCNTQVVHTISTCIHCSELSMAPPKPQRGWEI